MSYDEREIRFPTTGFSPPIAILSTLGIALLLLFAVLNKQGFGVDYNQFYSASHLAGTGHLYDWEALRKIEAENGMEVPTGRLPVVLYGHKLLGGLPYLVARSLWLAAGVAALIAFAFLWPGKRTRQLLVALACSMPAALVLLYGQDTPFWLLFFTAGFVFMDRNKPVSAGIAFSLCICKFHLALGIPILLVAQKRWKTLIAGGFATAALLGSCFLIEGSKWPIEYARISKMPQFSPALERMPSLFGLASWLPGTVAIVIAAAAAIVLLLWRACRSSGDIGMAAAVAAACGLLLAPHAYASDCVLLVPLGVLTICRADHAFWLKGWALALLSPAPVLLLVSPKPLLGQILIAAFVVAAIGVDLFSFAGVRAATKAGWPGARWSGAWRS